MKKPKDKDYITIFLVSTVPGFVSYLLISLFFARVLSWNLVLSSVILGPLIGNMIGFACALVGIPISERLESLPQPFRMVSQVLTFFVVALGAATLFFFLMVQFGVMPGFSTKLLFTFLLIAGGIGMLVTLLMTLYQHLKTELEKSYEKIREKELLEKELQVARQVQAGFLPRGPIRIEGFEVSTFFRPAKEVGGDYFDVIPLKSGVAVVIADVSGKGVPAALVAANLHATLHTLADDCCTVEAVTRINRGLFKDTPSHLFVTFFIGKLNNLTGEFTYINAGHNPPVVVRQDGTFMRLTQGGMVLGISSDSEFETDSVVLKPGDLLLLYTDGLTEAGLPEIEAMGEENVIELLIRFREKSTDSIVESIIKEVEKSTKGILQTDDIAMILLKRKR
ncbi:MAG: PP2C family protein-serine/threonine phosphatase [Candidatus Zixiibacteriota bacterium]